MTQGRCPAAQRHTLGPDPNNPRAFVGVCFLCGASCVSVAPLRSFSWCKRREPEPRGFGILQTQTELTSCHPPICTLAAREAAPRLFHRHPAHNPPVGLFLYGSAGWPSEDNHQNGLLGRIRAWVKTDGGCWAWGSRCFTVILKPKTAVTTEEPELRGENNGAKEPRLSSRRDRSTAAYMISSTLVNVLLHFICLHVLPPPLPHFLCVSQRKRCISRGPGRKGREEEGS